MSYAARALHNKENRITGTGDTAELIRELRLEFPSASIDLCDWDDHLWLWHLGVRQRSRGNGIGTALMRRVQDWCLANGRDIRLQAQAEPGHEAGLARFYARLGFVSNGGNELVWIT